MDSNWLSARMMVTRKPRETYAPMIALKCLMMWLFFILSNLPAEPNLICLEIVIKNGIPVTFMMSADSVTSLYCCIICRGMGVLSNRTLGDTDLVVFPFKHPSSGPHTNSAFLISWTVMGQFGMRFRAT